jgi:hypothetical protein
MFSCEKSWSWFHFHRGFNTHDLWIPMKGDGWLQPIHFDLGTYGWWTPNNPNSLLVETSVILVSWCYGVFHRTTYRFFCIIQPAHHQRWFVPGKLYTLKADIWYGLGVVVVWKWGAPPKTCHTFGKFSCSDKHIHDSLDKSVYFWWLNR